MNNSTEVMRLEDYNEKEYTDMEGYFEKYFCFDCPNCKSYNEFTAVIKNTASAVYCHYCGQKIVFGGNEDGRI